MTKGTAFDEIKSDFLNKRETLRKRRQSAETSQAEVAEVDTAELDIQQEFVNKDMEMRERLSRQHLAAQSAQGPARKTDNPMLSCRGCPIRP